MHSFIETTPREIPSGQRKSIKEDATNVTNCQLKNYKQFVFLRISSSFSHCTGWVVCTIQKESPGCSARGTTNYNENEQKTYL